MGDLSDSTQPVHHTSVDAESPACWDLAGPWPHSVVASGPSRLQSALHRCLSTVRIGCSKSAADSVSAVIGEHMQTSPVISLIASLTLGL